MSARVISLAAFRKAKIWRELKKRLELGEIVMPKRVI